MGILISANDELSFLFKRFHHQLRSVAIKPSEIALANRKYKIFTNTTKCHCLLMIDTRIYH